MSFSAGQDPEMPIRMAIITTEKHDDDGLNLFWSWTQCNQAILAQKLYFTDTETRGSFDQCWNSPILGTNYLCTRQLKPLGKAGSVLYICPQGGGCSVLTDEPVIFAEQGQDCLTIGLFTHGGAAVLGLLFLWFCGQGQPSLTQLLSCCPNSRAPRMGDTQMGT